MSDEDDEISCTSPASEAVAADTVKSLTPGSREMYERVYNRFTTWAKEQEVQDFTENVVLAYFTHLSKTLSSSSLWAQFSMLKSQLNNKDNVNIDCYKRVKVFLKQKSENFTPKKTKTFTDNQVDTFLRKAPDKKYLAMKVVLIFGISGACRCNELLLLKVQDIEFLEKVILVKIPKSDNCKPRSYIIDDEFYLKICKKYFSLRPEGMKTDRFFIKYQSGTCHRAVMGIHKISSIPKEVALFLKLSNANEYTGHCLRQTSAERCLKQTSTTGLVGNGRNHCSLKTHGGLSLTQKSENSTAKKGKTFTKDHIETFLREAPDKKYLAMKVVLIFGISGACRCSELINLRLQDIEFFEKIILVKIPEIDNCKPRSFVIEGDLYIQICNKYKSLRPEGIKTDRFFIKYQNGVCHKLVIGIHKISSIPKEVALFLKLADAKEYTGHCLRRTSTTLQVYKGSLKRHGGSSSTTVEDDSLRDIVVKIEDDIEDTEEPEISTIDDDVEDQKFDLQNGDWFILKKM